MTFPPEVWTGVLRRLRKELAPVSYEMWIPQIAAKSDGQSLKLGCPTQFHCDRVREYFLTTIGDCVAAEVGRRVPLRVEVQQPDSVDISNVDVERTIDAGINTNECANRSVVKTSASEFTAHPSSSPSLHAGADPISGSGISERDGASSISSNASAMPSTMRSMKPMDAAMSGIDAAGVWTAQADASAGTDATVRVPLRKAGRTRNTLSIDQALSASLPTSLGSAHHRAVDLAFDRSKLSTKPTTQSQVRPQIQQSPTSTENSQRPTVVAMKHARPTGPTSPSATFRQPTFPLTFDSFTVGSCNALAREASLAFANQAQASGGAGARANAAQLGLSQLFIVSEPGLGKTHLARAVINTTASAMGERARYTTAESFTSEFTHAVRGNEMANFKRRYRTQCDLLVVEDIQFLEGKVATQLEFFHTVQHVLDSGGRVLLTGDKYPQELSHLDERIRARISSGFVAQLDTPDAEVRCNILRAKAAHGGIRLPDDCLSMLVDKVVGNVRELEGALIQLVTISSLFKRPIDLDLTKESLHGRSRRINAITKRATPEAVIEAVAGFFQTSADSLASRSRRRDVLVPRQLSMYLCRRYTDASLADIGRLLNRDHPSVANAIRKIERQLLENVRLRYQVEAIIRRLDELGYRPLHTTDCSHATRIRTLRLFVPAQPCYDRGVRFHAHSHPDVSEHG